MDDLARGWAIFREHVHGLPLAVWSAIFLAIWVPIGAWRQKRNEKPAVADFRPIKRTPIPGSEKDYLRQPR